MAGKLGSFLGGVASGVAASAAYGAGRRKKKVADAQPEELGYSEEQKKEMAGPELLAGDEEKANGGMIGYADGGDVSASQRDVRKADRIPTSKMSGDERDRLLMNDVLPEKSGQNEIRMGVGQLNIDVDQSIKERQKHRHEFKDGTVDDVEEQGKRISKGLSKFRDYEHQYADGGVVEDKSKRRKQIDKGEEDALMANGGMVRQDLGGAKTSSSKYGVSGKMPVRDPRDMRKQDAAAIGVRADNDADDAGIMFLANGGAVYGNSPQGSYEASRYQENHSANPDAGMPGSSCTKRDYGK